ncbi:hemerythrin domain-containing protein [Falsiroseomonas oryzae]|uniref:hemerythrin domain-containing protein n=1 Tax=Falsiroseomonas oryzae TaxID=2766473 RepID=UPI0022EA8EBD|nr:hemerythrin domain-containing protein [Roseomonas sp. MO-31]
MDLIIPEALKAEHDGLHAELARATRLGGRTGEAAREVARLLHPHFEKEEEFALPPLALLATIARGETVPQETARTAAAMAARLQAELPEMLREHAAIVGALDSLSAAAGAEGHAEVTRFAEALKQHARTEEQLLYPAAVLIGAQLRLGNVPEPPAWAQA